MKKNAFEDIEIKDQENGPLVDRDLSWLSFNYRVLQEAMDVSNPLFERIKFLAIYSNNLEEFFRVRVSHHRNLVRLGKKTRKKLDYNPETTLKQILNTVNRQQEEFSDIFANHLIPELELQNINILHYSDLDEDQITFIEDYFNDNMLPFVQPVLLVQNRIRPFLNNGAIYLAMIIRPKGGSTERNQYALIKIPSDHLSRFIKLPAPKGQHEVIFLDDIVRYSASWLFPGYDIIDSFSIKLTRDAELYIEDEFSGDLISKIRKSLSKRSVGPASRFVYDREMPEGLRKFLVKNLSLDDSDLLPEGRYHNNADFFSFPDFGMTDQKSTPLPPLPYKRLEKAKNIFEAIAKKDHLINVPFHSYESTIRLFEEAAKDPKVSHIKVVQYRVAKKSRIMDALIKALNSGKKVTLFIEVKARFDEEANLRWGEKLEKAGATIHYSIPGIKVHSKLAIFQRMEKGKVKLYAYLSTGNFHEDTAKIYTDLSLFTADERLTKEAYRVFSYLSDFKENSSKFKHLLVGQFNLRTGLKSLIDFEISQAKKGNKASIFLKMNSLQDKKMINHLYKASKAGVEVKLIVRGICCLIPELKGISEKIEAISIVDRFLEHSRVFIFHNKGNEKIYLSSADWMTRNLSHRIETAFPIYDPAIRKQIMELMQIQLADNVKARTIDQEGLNQYRQGLNDLPNRSQMETYFYFKKLPKGK